MSNQSQLFSQDLPAITVLSADLLKRIFGLLDVQSLCSAAQVCQTWRATGEDDALWHQLAAQKWSAPTLRLQPYYEDYQALVQDDNKASAWPVIDLAARGACCTWRYNIPSRFYQCRLISLQYDPTTATLRLCYNARGEADLRHPATSQVALVADRPEFDFNPGGMEQPPYDDQFKSWKFKYDTSCTTLDTKRGQYKGWVEWSFQHAPLTGVVLDVNTSLVFCYANAVTQNPSQDYEADYLGAELLKIPAGMKFEEAFRRQCTSYQLPAEPEQGLMMQSQEDEQALWHSLPDTVKDKWLNTQFW